MNPRKAKDLLPELDLGLPLELLEDLTEYFWENNYKLITSLDYYHILIPHLGTWHIKGSIVLGKAIARLEKQCAPARKNSPKSSSAYVMYMNTEEQIRKLNILLDQYYKELKLKKENKILRRDVRLKKDLEQQKANS